MQYLNKIYSDFAFSVHSPECEFSNKNKTKPNQKKHKDKRNTCIYKNDRKHESKIYVSVLEFVFDK